MFCSDDQAVIFKKKQTFSYKEIFLIKYISDYGVQSSDQGKFSLLKVLYPGHKWFHRPYEVTTACYAKAVYITHVLLCWSHIIH